MSDQPPIDFIPSFDAEPDDESQQPADLSLPPSSSPESEGDSSDALTVRGYPPPEAPLDPVQTQPHQRPAEDQLDATQEARPVPDSTPPPAETGWLDSLILPNAGFEEPADLVREVDQPVVEDYVGGQREERQGRRGRSPTSILLIGALAVLALIVCGVLAFIGAYLAGLLPPAVTDLIPGAISTQIAGGQPASTSTQFSAATRTGGALIEPTGVVSPTGTPAVAVTLLLTPTRTTTVSPPTDTPRPTPIPAAPRPTNPPLPTPIPTRNAPTVTPFITTREGGISQSGVLMVYVPGGTFTMGSDAGGSESPAHAVTLSPYYIDQYEVTNASWAACVASGGCQPPGDTDAFDNSPYYGVEAFNGYPLVYVSWYNADAYCRWRGARLPTEAEWEMAARWNPVSGATTVYPWGNDWDRTRLNYCDSTCLLPDLTFVDPGYNDGWPQMAPVGTFPAGVSPVNAYDMAGNVAEWVADWFAADYYATSPATNPTGPAAGTAHVVRGGGWSLDRNWARSTSRSHFGALSQVAGVGLRCVVSAGAITP